jgi:hypothetical protein
MALIFNRESMGKTIFALAALLIFMTGCNQNYDAARIDLKAGLGGMTLEQAKQRWGEPKNYAEEAGKIKADWVIPHAGGLVNDRIYLTFDAKSRVLYGYRISHGPDK